MVLLALILNLTGWNRAVEQNVVGGCLLEAVSQLASITVVLTMLVVGYKMQFVNRQRLKISALFVLARYLLVFSVGYLFKFLILDRLVAPSPYFDHAFFILLSQFGSTMLVILVGRYCDREEMEISSNAFVLNAMAGIVLYLGYLALAA